MAFDFETLPGFFAQDDATTPDMTYDYMRMNFGLLDRKYETDRSDDSETSTQWQRFERYIRHLADSTDQRTRYKVIYLGRHGEGFHNVAEKKYGTAAWDAHWSKLDGDGELYWVDSWLTPTGEQQARSNHDFFATQLSRAKMPAPAAYYVSPMYRCLQTANLMFSGLALPLDRPFRPTVKEMMREVLGEHTCDRRSSKTAIREAVPDWVIEEGFREEDELWRADHRETFDEHDVRTRRLLKDVFTHDPHLFVSFTSHSGAIASLLRVIGHVQFKLPTGGLLPVLIKATRKD